MDFDAAKENIQPLASGRNASILQASLRVESAQGLLSKRKELETAIHNYQGDDPLDPWYEYIYWIEQSFPSGGKESGLEEVLSKCLTHFQSDERYYQDRRMIRLYIKFVESHKDSLECYQQLFDAGIGTMVADFYIAWAYRYDMEGNFQKAGEIFRHGIACHAEPIEDLEEAHQHFGFSVYQRSMFGADNNILENAKRQIEERRLALSSLRTQRNKRTIGSIRTGAAVKSHTPGTLQSHSSSHQQFVASSRNTHVTVLGSDENSPRLNVPVEVSSEIQSRDDPIGSLSRGAAATRSIVDKARHQENEREPGPWNKALGKKVSHNLYGNDATSGSSNNSPSFDILEDKPEKIVSVQPCITAEELRHHVLTYDKPLKLPPNFAKCNVPQKEWHTPINLDVPFSEPRTFPTYNKCLLYPGNNLEYQPEELYSYRYLRKRNIKNDFTKKLDEVWGQSEKGDLPGIRLYPTFVKQNKPQKMEEIDEFRKPEKFDNCLLSFGRIYDEDKKEEFQFEQLMTRWLTSNHNETVLLVRDMDETCCDMRVTNTSPAPITNRRKSVFNMRRSLTAAAANRKSLMPFKCDEANIGRPPVRELFEPQAQLPISGPILTTKAPIPQPPASTEEHRGKTIAEMPANEESMDTDGAMESVQATAGPVFEIYKDPTIILQTPKAAPNVIFQSTDGAMQEKPETETNFKRPATPKFANNLKLPFEIFTEESASSENAATGSKLPFFEVAETKETEFKALAPQKPTSDLKFRFSIFTEESEPLASDKNAAPIFDPEETCSTQVFNLFLKQQSSSTPKALRLFGGIPKDPPSLNPTAAKINIGKEEKKVSENSDNNEQKAKENQESRDKKDSTETNQKEIDSDLTDNKPSKSVSSESPSDVKSPDSESLKALEVKGSSQSPYNFSSPSGESLESAGSQQSSTRSLTPPPFRQLSTILETSEQPTNSGGSGGSAKSAIISPPDQIVQSTSAVQRDSNAVASTNFAIFQDTNCRTTTKTANTTAKAEREDTNTGFGFLANLPSIRFQEDKTETVPKFIKFQDDKTETLPKLPICTTSDLQALVVPTSTLPPIVKDLPTLPENPMETENPCTIFEPDVKEQAVNTEKNLEKDLSSLKLNDSDSFELFSKTPPKSAGFLRNQMNTATPLLSLAKRTCNQITPEPLQLQRTDELQHKLISEKPKVNILIRESLQLDFSVIDEQPLGDNLEPSNMKKDCMSSDLTFVPETQENFFSASKMDKQNSVVPDSQDRDNVVNLPQLHINQKVFGNDDSLMVVESQSSNSSRSLGAIPKTSQRNSISKFSFLNKSKSSKDQSSLGPSFLKTVQPVNRPSLLPKLKSSSDRSDSLAKLNAVNELEILKASFMRDFSMSCQPPKSIDEKDSKSLRSNDDQSTVNFLVPNISSSLLKPLTTPKNNICNERNTADNPPSFMYDMKDLDTFSQNLSSIKYSTLLPQTSAAAKKTTESAATVGVTTSFVAQMQIMEPSLHIKEEPNNSASKSQLNSSRLAFLKAPYTSSNPSSSKIPTYSYNNDETKFKATEREYSNKGTDTVCEITKQNQADFDEDNDNDNDNDGDNDEMSIYFKNSPKTPKITLHSWASVDSDYNDAHNRDDDENYLALTPNRNQYMDPVVNLDDTQLTINNLCVDPNVNPFNADLIKAFLEQNNFINIIKDQVPTCMLLGRIQNLKKGSTFKIHDTEFQIDKLIGEGAYGVIFSGTERKSGKKYAFKQERPPSFWEYYICLEVHSRMKNEHILPAFMPIDYALIGNNMSILVSPLSNYGSLITVCNKIKKQTSKNVDEYVVMVISCELLEIIDNLHAIEIIHADIKADNIILMKKLTYSNNYTPSLQLIDFGVSIDMWQFKAGQTFSYQHDNDAFNCVEMRENRPWTYQIDLCGLADVIHVLLFGKFMDIEKKCGMWMPKARFPRYFNKALWENIFRTLLNVPNCKMMPNLQGLRAMLKEQMMEKKKFIERSVAEFNAALNA